MAMLSTRFTSNTFGIVRDTPLDNSQLFSIAPSIFADGKHSSRSDRYSYIPTIDIVEGMRQNGLFPFMAVQSRSRVPGKSEYTKHMLRFRPDNKISAPEAYEVILINSHDGTSSYQLMAGVFRFVCQNGMVCGDVVDDFRVHHKGDITNDVIDAAFRIIDEKDCVANSIDTMKSVTLLPDEQRVFANAALALRYDDPPIDPMQILATRRYADRDGISSLWGTFNRVQEHLTKGGLEGRTSAGKRTVTRSIRSIDNNVGLNRSLWMLAEGMAALKNA
ncbi:MAG: DUF945 domain-containing protein [Peptococcaceae bacterium]|nr:DUF945 domain-containing protein [Peptococcaceae bacterium]